MQNGFRTSPRHRRLLVAGAAAAVLFSGWGVATAVAGSGPGQGDDRTTAAGSSASPAPSDDSRDDSRQRGGGKRAWVESAGTDAKGAVEAALRALPGAVVTGLEIDDDARGNAVWEVEVIDTDGVERTMIVGTDGRAVPVPSASAGGHSGRHGRDDGGHDDRGGHRDRDDRVEPGDDRDDRKGRDDD